MNAQNQMGGVHLLATTLLAHISVSVHRGSGCQQMARLV